MPDGVSTLQEDPKRTRMDFENWQGELERKEKYVERLTEQLKKEREQSEREIVQLKEKMLAEVQKERDAIAPKTKALSEQEARLNAWDAQMREQGLNSKRLEKELLRQTESLSITEKAFKENEISRVKKHLDEMASLKLERDSFNIERDQFNALRTSQEAQLQQTESRLKDLNTSISKRQAELEALNIEIETERTVFNSEKKAHEQLVSRETLSLEEQSRKVDVLASDASAKIHLAEEKLKEASDILRIAEEKQKANALEDSRLGVMRQEFETRELKFKVEARRIDRLVEQYQLREKLSKEELAS